MVKNVVWTTIGALLRHFNPHQISQFASMTRQEIIEIVFECYFHPYIEDRDQIFKKNRFPGILRI
jgi:hypothetical protein